MTSPNTRNTDVLQEYINSLLDEVLGKFNLAKFRAIANTNERPPEVSQKPWHAEHTDHPELLYAKANLPKLGEGSSRVTFALSNNKVLKIALNPAGISQNQAEIDVWNKFGDTGMITSIYDYDKTGSKWIIAEIVKEFSEKELLTRLGVTPSLFQTFVDYMLRNIYEFDTVVRMLERDYKKDIEYVEKNKEWYLKHEPDAYKSIIQSMKSLETIKNNTTFKDFLTRLVDFRQKSNISKDDLRVPEHYGVTLDGKIKLLDYGLTSDVQSKHY